MTTGKDRLKRLGRLEDRKVREAEGLRLLEGPRLVADALAAGCVTRLFVRDEAAEAHWAEAAGRVPIEVVGERGLEILSTVRTPQEVAAIGPLPDDEPLPALAAAHSRLLLLDAIQDPGNVGTLARTAEALGVGGLILTPGCADPASPKVLRASAGALVRLRVARVEAPEEWAPTLEAAAHRLVVPVVSGGQPVTEVAAPPRFCLVAGNEGQGSSLGEIPGALCVTIPLAPACDSLNVAAAMAVILGRWLPSSSPS